MFVLHWPLLGTLPSGVEGAARGRSSTRGVAGAPPLSTVACMAMSANGEIASVVDESEGEVGVSGAAFWALGLAAVPVKWVWRRLRRERRGLARLWGKWARRSWWGA